MKRIFKDFDLSFSDFELFFKEFTGQINKKFKTLSGGQRRLLEVYLIIKTKSAFTILDEPFSQIMPLHIEGIKKLILLESAKKGFLITDHMFEHVIDISKTLYVLKDGKTHLAQSPQDIEWLGYISGVADKR